MAATATIWSIATFVLERIAEDDALASAAGTAAWSGLNGIQVTGPDGIEIATAGAPLGTRRSATVAHLARYDPARVLAECAAKRAVVDVALRSLALNVDCARSEPSAIGWDALRALARPYASHPDYSPDWSTRPSTSSHSNNAAGTGD